MYLIDNILVDENISNKHFLCDLKKCKGGCCTIKGETGAPLLAEEINILEKIYPIVKPYLCNKSISYIEKHGMAQGEEGDYSTRTIDSYDCVFVFYRDGIAFCAIEQAYIDKKIDFKKPVSCHLFPVRVSDFGGTALYYEKMDVCKPALQNGKAQNVKIYQMTEEAFERSFGKLWTRKYKKFVEERENQK